MNEVSGMLCFGNNWKCMGLSRHLSVCSLQFLNSVFRRRLMKVLEVFLSPLEVMKWVSFLKITAYSRKSKTNGDYKQNKSYANY